MAPATPLSCTTVHCTTSGSAAYLTAPSSDVCIALIKSITSQYSTTHAHQHYGTMQQYPAALNSSTTTLISSTNLQHLSMHNEQHYSAALDCTTPLRLLSTSQDSAALISLSTFQQCHTAALQRGTKHFAAAPHYIAQ